VTKPVLGDSLSVAYEAWCSQITKGQLDRDLAWNTWFQFKDDHVREEVHFPVLEELRLWLENHTREF